VITTEAIPPGGEGEIKVTFQAGVKGGAAKKSISITSNDPANPHATIRIEAMVVIALGFDPMTLDLGNIRRTDTLEREVNVVAENPKALQITGITSSSPFISAKRIADTTIADTVRIRVLVTVVPGLPLGLIQETITARFNVEKNPETKLGLYGIIVDEVEITPQVLTFTVSDSTRAPGDTVRTLQVANNRPQEPLEILDIRDPDNRLTLKLEPRDVGKRYKLTATLKKQDYSFETMMSGNIILTTNNPRQKEVIVPYRIVR
jgi:hypothetical protein